MHLQQGIPQLYHDQMNVLGEHLWELWHDPEWNEALEEALACLEVMRKDTYNELSQSERELLHRALKTVTVKKQRKLTRKLLQQRPDWKEWEESEFKQLDQYHDQDTFREPEPRP